MALSCDAYVIFDSAATVFVKYFDVVGVKERPRPEYAAKCTMYEKNPITGIKEPYFPKRERIPRIVSGLGVIVLMVLMRILYKYTSVYTSYSTNML